jgi:hypothetical protein
MRLESIPLCAAAVVAAAGCGGGGSSSATRASEQRPPPRVAVAGVRSVAPIERVAHHAVEIVHPGDCARWFEPPGGVDLCNAYVADGSLHAGAYVESVAKLPTGAVRVRMRHPGGNAFELLMRRRGGRWLVYDGVYYLPAAKGKPSP